MFENLTDRLSKTLKTITGKAKLTEDNIKDTLREVRIALLEADVALPVVKEFVSRIKERAIGQEVQGSLTPGQAFVKIVKNVLTDAMGEVNTELNLNTQPPAIILMAGLQGVGKTTTVGKLATFLQTNKRKKVMVVSADVYRPAAIDQLQKIAEDNQINFFPSVASDNPIHICQKAIEAARNNHMDVLLIDTAGRLHVDQNMMEEIKQIQQATSPIETLFVVDAMTGQDAANTAKAFSEALDLTGVILTKIDGDARGGAALSVKTITGKPIKFIGTGEKNDALEIFHPDRIASRILGMGDILSLIEQAEQRLDADKTQALAKKIKKGSSFDFEDLREQLQQMKKMGSLGGILNKLPGMGTLAGKLEGQLDQKLFNQMEAIICSMTAKERAFPDIINGSRKKRIAQGSGTQIQDVNKLIKQHKQMSKMVKKMGKKGGLKRLMSSFDAMNKTGGMPNHLASGKRGGFF